MQAAKTDCISFQKKVLYKHQNICLGGFYEKKNPIFTLVFLAALAVFLFAAIKLGTLSFRYYKEDALDRLKLIRKKAFGDFSESLDFTEYIIITR